MQKPIMSLARRTQFVVAVVAAGFIVVGTALATLVMRSIDTMAVTADRIDDRRALQAGEAALQSLRKQLAATVRDNAFWDDAYRQMASEDALAWAVENWGVTTAGYPLYDTAMVIGPDNKPVMAYHSGDELASPPQQFFATFRDILQAARQADAKAQVPVHFIHSPKGTALIGAALIQPYEADPSVDRDDLAVLVFAKHVTAEVVQDIAEGFNIAGLRLDAETVPGRLDVPLRDVKGETIAVLTWPPQLPGTASYALVEGDIQYAGLILVLFLAAIGIVGVVTGRNLRTSERRARHKALHDALTGLRNRAGLFEGIDLMLANARGEGASVDLLLIDLDGFKGVNDAWGHAVGDALIVAVARRLSDTLPDDVLLARLGGDEFAVVAGSGGGDRTPPLGEQIQIALSRVFEIGGRSIEIGASIGVAVSRADIDVGELIRRADIALYRAKDLGRGVTVHFETSFDEDTVRLAELESQLRETLSIGGLEVFFQPLVDAGSDQIRGVEALARWTTEAGQKIRPDVFIPLAERAGLIDQLGLQVLQTSLKAAAAWPGISLSVNVSPLQLKNPKFVSQVRDAIETAEFDPCRLTIELTEGVLISNPDQARRAIDGLKAAGVQIALDDFGSGFASIGTLRQFGFDRMKIDRSLIEALEHDANAGAVLQATIALANAFAIPVTAEGVETEEQAMMVRLSGCDALQGYLFSKPICAADLTARYFLKASSEQVA
ncbi:EAL domain-containing protein [Rhizobium sp. TRM95111]|uniref:putative bifunctional diguanylate cyclase/phosphodiesterase n=1 Tax=Rhizobium alarense TaxID=2846851 RepID=UPI001F1C6B08|nr:EAL domain-containing protein [Rhizobium alarense]MCF3641057.1 EAL domain-containing protein [Rhizobium alarense]